MTTPIGGLIKYYRTRHNISQQDIAFALGWSEPSRLSRIEKGKIVKPKRELLDDIMNAMKLPEEEKNDILLRGSYFHTEEEIEKVRKETDEVIREWPYSAVAYDFAWRVLHFNKTVIDLYRIPQFYEDIIRKEHLWLPEIVFNPHFTQNLAFKGKEQEEWEEFQMTFLVRFKYAQHTRRKEKWYLDLITRLMDIDQFRKIWLMTDKAPKLKAVNFGQVSPIVNPRDHSKVLKIHFSMVPWLNDPRVEFDLDTPADIDTFKYFQQS